MPNDWALIELKKFLPLKKKRKNEIWKSKNARKWIYFIVCNLSFYIIVLVLHLWFKYNTVENIGLPQQICATETNLEPK